MIYHLSWNDNAKTHLGDNARTGTESYDSFETLLKNMPSACGGLEMGLSGNGILTPLILDTEVYSDKDIEFWINDCGLKELPLFAKDKDFLLYQDIRAGRYRSVEVAKVKIECN
ncbi:MAG: hypothetical protein KAJ20_03740 [Candidatus Aenigmarchaeota archaeon]|nr:hypothetical protein [Candidatus Aenigmarchaeota archaeon]MCK5290136.1 hypothetical protein [Candidatus Aenigmarchaeota archaeon]MCK5373425.1 hypothetical protein [Candidatus Aenigmarchaeota archaeon]MCK5452241.1 hypothetical protein [Candidatus Aenigmarchaeota archaeon]